MIIIHNPQLPLRLLHCNYKKNAKPDASYQHHRHHHHHRLVLQPGVTWSKIRKPQTTNTQEHSLFFQRFLKQSDQTQSGDVGLAEFIHYVREHEKNLRLQFTHLDKNRDGKVDLEEMIEAFKELGIDMDRVEAAKLLKRCGADFLEIVLKI